ncbi:hypothetical protein [Chondrinema litorale]|uniref:hypothetical protein n=1 Tax=Chondrinema litorale TaxID=2994555 RepID=UPI0025438CDE|nr:hypothetical protein [Chondrinema litorale]UZR93468.1 hypothetical protein OQ292_16565 [Chondrinema litorale]
MIIKKKKSERLTEVIISIPFVLIIMTIIFWGLFDDFDPELPMFFKAFYLVFIWLAFMGIRSNYRYLLKIFSSNPEFELTENELIIFDNPKYDSIPFSEIIDCTLLYPSKAPNQLFLILKPDSDIIGNTNKIINRIRFTSSNYEAVRLSLGFADIKPEKLLELIKERINKTEKISS